jgi:hypothetical protein
MPEMVAGRHRGVASRLGLATEAHLMNVSDALKERQITCRNLGVECMAAPKRRLPVSERHKIGMSFNFAYCFGCRGFEGA